MNYKNINNYLAQTFPELSSCFEEQVRLWHGDDIPPHCFFGDVLNGYVAELLRKNNDTLQIKKVFQFYEDMANSSDEDVRNLLQVTLLEYLWDEDIVFLRAVENMGAATRKINAQISLYLNEPISSCDL